MRICLVSYEFPPIGGGEGAYTNDLIRALSAKGLEVVLIVPKWPGLSINRPNQNHSVIHVDPLLLPGFKTTSFMLRANRKLKQIAGRIDIIHYTNDYCGFGMSSAEIGKPVLATLHHTHYLESTSVLPRVKQNIISEVKFRVSQRFLARLEWSTLRNADSIIAVSNYTAENAKIVYPSLSSRIRVVLNGIDESRFSPGLNGNIFRSTLGLSSEPIVLYVGRIALSKGLRFLIDAFYTVVKEIPEAKLVIVGSGAREEEAILKAQVTLSNMNSSVIFTGRVNAEELPMIYASSDLVVLPSLVEGFGLVLLEAMAESKPVVTTNVGPTTEIISDGVEGVLVPSADTRALADGILKILGDKSLSAWMGEQGRRKVERLFTLDRWSTQMVELYEDCLANFNSTSRGNR